MSPVESKNLKKGNRNPLPARVSEFRHTYRTVCADLGIDEAMREAQRKISRRIVGLLWIEFPCLLRQ